MKKLYLLILIFSLIISCSNPPTTPDNNNNNNNNNSVKAVSSGMHTVHYGSKTSDVNAADKNGLKNLWLDLVRDKKVYKSKYDTKESGKFDREGSYYDIIDESNIRTKIVDYAVYEYNNKKYLTGIYWDNKTGVGMQIRYRLIMVDADGTIMAWYGGGSYESVKPNENTSDWVKYDFPFGYLKKF